MKKARKPESTNGTPVDSSIADYVKPQMLRFQVGQAMFCPACRQIMDCAAAVAIDALKNGTLVTSKVMCARCYDKRIAPQLDSMKAELGCEFDITDGRKINWRNVPRARS